ncbi:MAG TPA: neutral/alkaline non-lysosomal ceramidase N-terminal domain-containing protein [Chitinophagales bacterium]|nr:neutral/alkaline non-lysosomal ceramidase N-terminal domain-containing protein [Chitinophagales bacterium]
MKKLLYIFLSLLVVLLLVAITCFKPLDNTPYQQTEFYKQQLAAIDSAVQFHHPISSTQNLEVGWARVNLLPPFTTPIAIDANRGGKHFEGVHDSIYVRAFVFKQGNTKVAYISADLLIIPPSVTKLFDTILQQQGFDQSNIYFTATHTHTSLGAWYNSVVGKIFAGKYDERVPVFIAQCISNAIVEAEKNCAPAKIGYGEYTTRKLVFNRLITQMAHLPDSLGEVDSLIRVVKIEKQTGEKAAIITFAAHNTVFHENLMRISGDWSGLLMKQLNESGKMDFACFSAGAVGSHGPYEVTKDQEAEAKYIANGVAKIVLQSFDGIPVAAIDSATPITFHHLSLYLREPNLRVSDNIVVRPWLFKKLFGNEPMHINTLKIGNIFFAGMPCDFSGELINEIDSAARENNLHAVVTSFNGGYVGYITDSRRYNLNTYETRVMGWFGDRNGEYMSEVVMRMMAE